MEGKERKMEERKDNARKRRRKERNLFTNGKTALEHRQQRKLKHSRRIQCEWDDKKGKWKKRKDMRRTRIGRERNVFIAGKTGSCNTGREKITVKSQSIMSWKRRIKEKRRMRK